MSFILRPNLTSNDAVLITTAASVAVARAIEEVTHIHTGIKWVNDVYMNGKKICGILTEALTDFESGGIEQLFLESVLTLVPLFLLFLKTFSRK